MKELQAANENKQQELETVRKVRMATGPEEGCFTVGATATFLISFDSIKTRCTVLARCFGKLFSQEVCLDC